MQLFVWLSEATTGYHQGTIAVAAESVEQAREIITSDLDRWLRYGGSSPVHYLIYDSGPDSTWDEDDLTTVEETRAELLADIASEPVTLSEAGVFWHGGGD